MDTWQLWKKLGPHGDHHVGPFFAGVFPCNRLPRESRRPLGLVANLDPANQPGSHWVAILLLPYGQGEYFDSFGFPPLNAFLADYMTEQCPSGWIYNSRMLQSPSSAVCGHFCITFLSLRFRGIALPDIVHLFSATDFRANDHKVFHYVSNLYQ